MKLWATSKVGSRISLAARLMLGSGAAMAISGAMIVYSVVLSEITFNREDLTKELESQIEFLAPAITEQAIVGDYSVLQQMLTVHAQRDEVEEVSWIDTRGNPINGVGPVVQSQAPAWFAKWVGIPLLVQSKAINVGGVKYGDLHLKLTPAGVINNIWQGFVDKVQVLVLGIGIFIAVTLTIITNGLRPLYALASSARRFGQGDYTVRVAPEGAPEMLASLNAFNSMADSIESLLKSLRESDANNRRLATIVEQSSEAIITKDLNGIITTWNGGATRLYGYSAEEAIGKPAAFMQAPDASDQDVWCNNQAMTTDMAIAYETRRLTKSGSVVDVDMSIAPLVNEKNEPIGTMGIAHDISERKQSQEALQAAKEAAEAANLAKSQFLANMSHEIRTPMNGVLGMTELLLNTDLTEQQHRYAQTVHTSGEALLNVINEVLDFSKIEAGKLELERIDFSLRQVAEDVSELLAGPAHAKDVELICHVDDQVPARLRGDPSRLRQVLTNLVGNAVKFTETGQIIAHVGLEPMETSPEPGHVVVKLSVTDTGPGIPVQVQERIFEAFSQADGSTTRKYGGTGLGLTIARQLAHIMGGKIGVISEVGMGSTFWFTARLEEASNPLHDEPLQQRDLVGLPALVVDDNATNREILLQQLSSWGMRVDVANSGADALDLLRSRSDHEPYRFAILDMHMPEMDGLQLAARIKEHPAHASLALVILSSVGKDMPTHTLATNGISRWITKPIRRSQLFNALLGLIQAPQAAEPVSKPAPCTEPARLSGKILLAEDNPVNQEVAAAMLQGLGCRVMVANDGRETIVALARERFDLVLMDCHMPELDGFSTVALIREKEAADHPGLADADRPRLPVIALTANAMHGDRERCLAAGMDDYLTKPFNQKQLHALLKRWLPHQHDALAAGPELGSTQAGPVAPPPQAIESYAGDSAKTSDDPNRHSRLNQPSTSPEDSPLAPAALDNIRALQAKSGNDILVKVVQLYFASAPEQLQTMQEAISRGDHRALQMAAHTLKSSSANVGAMKLADLCKEVEQEARAGEMTRADARLLRMANEYERVWVALKAQLATREST